MVRFYKSLSQGNIQIPCTILICVNSGVSQNGNAAHGSQNGVGHPSSQATLSHPLPIMPMPAGVPAGVGGPTTALNIGMDYWGAPTPSSIPPVRGKVPATTVAGAILPGSRESVPSELWLQV